MFTQVAACRFEVATAVLGDHGQTPQRDFLILTAADRQNERFYTTLELLEFCHRFRLHHKDIWTDTTIESARNLLDWYDTNRETGESSKGNVQYSL